MAKGKNVLTTGEVARICNVAPRTVSKWFDSGQLKGYRIPGSKDRRIPVTELMRFMRKHNMPTAALPMDRIRVLVVDSDIERGSTLANDLSIKTNYDVQTVNSNFETGIIAQKFAPHVLLINLLAKDIDTADICQNIKSNEKLQIIKVVALANKLSDPESAALFNKGFDTFISNTLDIREIVAKIEEVIAIVY